jgi:mannose-1-phosphate guanylyltransferase
MFQHAVDRIEPLFGAGRIRVVTGLAHAPILAAQTPALPRDNFFVEPEGRGTAPAIGLAAIRLFKEDRDAVMAVLTADHFIGDAAGFRRALEVGARVAQQGRLVTLGIKPSFASTGFGYIKQGDLLDEIGDTRVYGVECFIEKPDGPTAADMVASGQYSWNSGMFIWRVDRILAEFSRLMPALYAQLKQIEATLGAPGYEETLGRIWPDVVKETIDYGIMEKARDVVVIPADIGWTDIGNWSSLFDVLPADENGNAATGPFVGIDTHDTLAFGGKRLIAAIGVRGMVIVDTDDALLICPREREQEVREMVSKLRKEGHGGLL